MLGYLDALIAALSVRDVPEVQRLLAHPLARLLPGDVRDEATAFSAGAPDALAAPLRAMQLRHQTAELLRDAAVVDGSATDPAPAMTPAESARVTLPPTVRARRVARPPQQMELPLSA